MNIKYFIFTLFYITSLNLQAGALYEEHYSVRALAMGNAYTAVVKNRDALYYNPAALSRMQGYYFTLFDLKGGLNGEEVITTISDVADAADLSGSLDALYDKRIYLGAGAQAAFAMKNFAFSYYLQGSLEPYLSNPTFPTYDITYYNDTGYATGFSFNMSELFAMGFVLRRVSRTGGNIPIGTDVLQSLTGSDITDELNRTGLGYGLDVGFLFNIPSLFPSRVSFVYKNLGKMNFKKTGTTTTAPDSVDSEIILGWSMDVDLPLITITPSFDYKHIQSDVPFGMKTHIGLEVDLPLITLRGGFNQGYLSYGIGTSLGPLDIDFASYGVELGAYPGQWEDRRYMIELSMELGFDIDFNFSDFGSSQRRKLKQRR